MVLPGAMASVANESFAIIYSTYFALHCFVVYAQGECSWDTGMAIRLLFALLVLAISAICYYPDGSTAPEDPPCALDRQDVFCCGPGYVCLSNRLCMSIPSTKDPGSSDTYVRGSCTDQKWNSPNCPLFGLNPQLGECHPGRLHKTSHADWGLAQRPRQWRLRRTEMRRRPRLFLLLHRQYPAELQLHVRLRCVALCRDAERLDDDRSVCHTNTIPIHNITNLNIDAISPDAAFLKYRCTIKLSNERNDEYRWTDRLGIISGGAIRTRNCNRCRCGRPARLSSRHWTCPTWVPLPAPWEATTYLKPRDRTAAKGPRDIGGSSGAQK